MKENKKVSQEELHRAVNKFIKAGGIIQKLPDQKTLVQSRVGGKWCTTEVGSESGA